METLQWDILEKPVFVNDKEIENYKAILRNDNGNILNVAKKSYTPTPNSRFVEVTERLHEITGFPIENYFEVDGGKKILAYLKCTEPIQVCGHEFKDYLMIGNSHDGSTGFFMGNSNMMVRCKNRFAKSFRQLQVNHTKGSPEKIDELVEYFNKFMRFRRRMFADMESFEKIKIDKSIREALVQRLTNMSLEEKLGTAELSSRKKNIIEKINSSIDRECQDLGDNAFGLFNGITHYTTHFKPTKNKDIWATPFGSVNDMNQTAFNYCNDLVMCH